MSWRYHRTDEGCGDRQIGSARESGKPRDSSGSAVLAFIVPAAALAGGMWKPATCAGSQALWESWESPIFDFSPISTARHFHSEAAIPVKSGPLRSQTYWPHGSGLIRHILESHLKCALRQILVQSRQIEVRCRTAGVDKQQAADIQRDGSQAQAAQRWRRETQR